MAALISALDNVTPKQIGENGHVEYGWSNSIQEQILQLSFQLSHVEYGWSNSIQEQILQLSFQLTRTYQARLTKLSDVLHQLLTNVKYKIENGNLPERDVAKGYLSILYRMIGHTRDIVDGKGEYTLSYMMVYTWHKFYPELAQFALRTFVNHNEHTIHPYGSWKDLKYFCEYCYEQTKNYEHPLIHYSVNLINDQLRRDYINMTSSLNDISLVAKWVPREKSKFTWLYNKLSINYFNDYLLTAKTCDQHRKATLKCKTEYRKVISSLNRHLDTLQIKQCQKEWSAIDFNKVTSISLSKQKKAFLNIKKDGDVRFPESSDRITCAANFHAHIKKAISGETEMKGKRVSMVDFTKQAIRMLTFKGTAQEEKDLLNSQWRDNSTQNGQLGKMIAMVDVSGSMDGDPLYAAISLGIRIAEKSIIGKRVMTFSSKPTWVNLEPYPDFVSQVEFVRKAEWRMNTNFHAALDLILDAIVDNNMRHQDVQDMVLVVLSDMQMDDGDSCDKESLYNIMTTKYHEAGIRVNGVPYKLPHILFWNLRSTSGFPALSNHPNTSMVSGFSPALLNLFCDTGLDAFQRLTPWTLFIKSLENERYQIMEDKLNQYIV